MSPETTNNYGDVVQGDNINIDNIENSNAVAIGTGATAVYNAGLSTEAVAKLVIELKRIDQPDVWNGRFPYLGLTAFQESDAQFFFGRESLVEELLERVQEARFIVIAGPSGSGKSSVARAGLFHALREGGLDKSDGWLLATMQPKGDPIEQLAVAIDRMMERPGAGDYVRENGRSAPLALHEQIKPLLSDDPRQRCVLLVDQFEETFTQTKKEDRAAFINLLTEAAGVKNGRVAIILSLRADFVSHCARYPALRALMSQQFQLVGAMDPSDLAKAITLPALEVGAKIDPELVSRIMSDMKGEPGALPLMSFALRDLFEAEKSTKGEAMDLTLSEYLKRGGIESALARHANSVFDTFTDEQKGLARGVFSKLIEVGQGRADTRRTAVFKELIPAGVEDGAVTAVVDALAQEGVRLITTSGSGGTVTIAHEKLIDAWPWLRQLVDENREMIVLQNQINDDAKAWAKKEDDGYLYRGGRLIQVEEQLKASNPDLNELSQKFIQASLDQRKKEIEEKEAQQRREIEQAQELAEEQRQRAEAEQKRSSLFRKALIGGSILLLFLLVAMVIAGVQTNNANENLRTSNALGTSVAEERNIKSMALATSEASDNARATAIVRAETEASLARMAEATATVALGEAETQRNKALAAAEAEAEALVEAQDQTTIAQEQAQLAEARALAAQSQTAITQFDSKPAYLLAIQAVDSYEYDGKPIDEAEVVLTKALIELPFLADMAGHDETGSVYSVSFNYDGSQMVTASDDGTARLWSKAGDSLNTLTHNAAVSSAQFNHTGSLILTTSLDKTAWIWDSDGNFITTLEADGSGINSATFNDDGSRIVTSHDDNTVQQWDDNGNFINIFEGHEAGVNLAVFNRDGDRVLTASDDNTARLWDSDGTFLFQLEHDSAVKTVAFNRDGSRILTVSGSGLFGDTMRLWDGDGVFLTALEGHEFGSIFSTGFSPDGNHILTAGIDGTARLWDRDGNPITTLLGHTNGVNSAIFNHDGTRILTASADNTARIWDGDGRFLTSLEGHSLWWMYSAVFSPDSSHIVTTGGGGTVGLWNGNGSFLTTLEGHDGQLTSASFNHDSSRVATASNDNTARIWDKNGNLFVVLEGHDGAVNSVVFSPDGNQILTASNDNSARLWDKDGNFSIALEGHGGRVNSAAFNPDGSRIITASSDGTARLWNDNGDFITFLDENTNGVNSAVFNHDGSRILTISDGIMHLWDGDGVFITSIAGYANGGFSSAVFNHDGSRIATTDSDYTARLWDSDGNFISTLAGHDGVVYTVAFNHDDTRIITASRDKTIRLWDGDGRFITAITAVETPNGMVTSANFNHDGSQIISTSTDGVARIWEISTSIDEMYSEAVRRLLPLLTEEECLEYFHTTTCQPDA